MPSLPYRPRITQIIGDKSIAAGGETINADLPSEYTVTGLLITQKKVQTGAVSLAQQLASLDQFEMVTRSGGPWKISGADLFYFNRDLLGKEPHISQNSVDTNDYILYESLLVPFNPLGIWNTQFGVSPRTRGAVRLTMGTDTNSACDDRTVTVAAIGYEGLNPAEYMGCFVDPFTSIASDNFRDIQSDRVSGMMGVYHFQTTGVEDLTTSDAPGLKDIGWAVAKSVREKVRAHGLQLLESAWNTNARAETVGLPNSKYTLMNLGLRNGQYVPYTNHLQIYLNCGVAEAARTHPLLLSLIHI